MYVCMWCVVFILLLSVYKYIYIHHLSCMYIYIYIHAYALNVNVPIYNVSKHVYIAHVRIYISSCICVMQLMRGLKLEGITGLKLASLDFG